MNESTTDFICLCQALKADTELKQAAAATIGLTVEENQFYLPLIKKSEFCKQFGKALRLV